MIAESRIPVRYAETDKMGIVYHANYLVWFEIGRTEFLNQLGYPYAKLEEEGIMSPVLDIQVSYGPPLTYGDTAIVCTRVTKLTPVRTVYAYEVYKEGQEIGVDKPCVTGTSTHCVVDAKTFKPISQKRSNPELYAAYQAALEE